MPCNNPITAKSSRSSPRATAAWCQQACLKMYASQPGNPLHRLGHAEPNTAACRMLWYITATSIPAGARGLSPVPQPVVQTLPARYGAALQPVLLASQTQPGQSPSAALTAARFPTAEPLSAPRAQATQAGHRHSASLRLLCVLICLAMCVLPCCATWLHALPKKVLLWAQGHTMAVTGTSKQTVRTATPPHPPSSSSSFLESWNSCAAAACSWPSTSCSSLLLAARLASTPSSDTCLLDTAADSSASVAWRALSSAAASAAAFRVLRRATAAQVHTITGRLRHARASSYPMMCCYTSFTAMRPHIDITDLPCHTLLSS